MWLQFERLFLPTVVSAAIAHFAVPDKWYPRTTLGELILSGVCTGILVFLLGD